MSIIFFCIHVNVYMHFRVQRLVQQGWAGNGCMYNASVVHFQASKAHDAADAQSELRPTTLWICLPLSLQAHGAKGLFPTVKSQCARSVGM